VNNFTNLQVRQHATGFGAVQAPSLSRPPPFPARRPKQLAVTGGTGAYGNAGGDGTLVEFGNGQGKLTLHLLSLVARGGGG
jgi:hypothetical protein